VAVALFLLSGIVPVRAVILFSTGDAGYNTNAPAGALTNSGWQLEGQWNGFLGTPIAPTFFLAAKHVGGDTGQVFALNGYNYHTIASTDSTNSDLRVWQVAETFPFYAKLFTSTNEVGRHCVVFGRGTQRGDAVVIDGNTNGWLWGAGDGLERWGENDVTSIENNPGLGDFLRCTFDRGASTTNECHLSNGDSSGGLFIQDGTDWKLAGIHYAVDGPFSTNSLGSNSFQAALVDMRGLYRNDGESWVEVPTNPPIDAPSAFYSTRISAHVDWINSVINFQTGPDLRITDVAAAGDDMQVSVATGTNRLYRLDRCDDLVAGSWTIVTNNLTGTGGTLTINDPGSAGLPKRFYRFKLVQ